jgi:hypothetical protein
MKKDWITGFCIKHFIFVQLILPARVPESQTIRTTWSIGYNVDFCFYSIVRKMPAYALSTQTFVTSKRMPKLLKELQV